MPAKKGLYANIHAKQERIKNGSGEHMKKKGEEGAPEKEDFDKSEKTAKPAKKAAASKKTAAKKTAAKKTAPAKKTPAAKKAAPAKKAAAKKAAAKKTKSDK
ncbi:hypothetical protein ACSFA3_04200 [Variovorax sp. RHLX14]|uniref:hypothetical protein n=1 Tax=Variovorax sp. RHLX14 TaxID=1259731 RepID=UPI003F48FC91